MPGLARYPRGHGRRKPGPWSRIDWSHQLANGLVGAYLFNEAGGNSFGKTGNPNNLAYTGTTPAPGGFGRAAAQFNGTSDFAQLTSALVTAAPCTLALLFTPNSAKDADILQVSARTVALTSWNAFILQQRTTGGQLLRAGRFSTGTSTFATSTATYTLGVPCLGVAVFAGSASATIYLNAAPGVTDVTSNTPGSMDTTCVGGRAVNNTHNNFGAITADMALIYNRALSAAEVAWLYAEPFAFLLSPAPVRFFFSPGGPVSNTLTASPGSYALSGAATTLTVNRPLSASPGSYSISGAAATLKVNRPLTASAGAYTISGSAATLKVNRALTAAPGAYTISGAAASLPVGRSLTAAPGSYTLSGAPATLTYHPGSSTAYTLTASPGSYTITGAAVGFGSAHVFPTVPPAPTPAGGPSVAIPQAIPRELDFSGDWQFWKGDVDLSQDWQFWLGDIDLSNDWQFWMNTETVTLSSHRSDGDMTCTIDVCKRRAMTGKELAASNGVYTGDDVLFLIPNAFLPEGILPKPGDVITDEDGTEFTAIGVDGRKRDRNNQYQTWALSCRDLVLANDLAHSIDIQAPTILIDEAGGKLKLWPEDGRGSTPYKALKARVQLLTEDMADERGIRGWKGTHAVIVSKPLKVDAAFSENRVKWTSGGKTVYLAIVGYHNPQRVDELPVLDCTLAP